MQAQPEAHPTGAVSISEALPEALASGQFATTQKLEQHAVWGVWGSRLCLGRQGASGYAFLGTSDSSSTRGHTGGQRRGRCLPTTPQPERL